MTLGKRLLTELFWGEQGHAALAPITPRASNQRIVAVNENVLRFCFMDKYICYLLIGPPGAGKGQNQGPNQPPTIGRPAPPGRSLRQPNSAAFAARAAIPAIAGDNQLIDRQVSNDPAS